MNGDFDGILLIDKPTGITSHDVVDRVRKILKMRKVGHAGTLDPMATGLMIVLLGKATKLSQYLMSMSKVYEGTITLGQETDSQDADGEVLLELPVPNLDEAALRENMDSFLGDQYQMPPMFSAIKKNGVPLYKMARKGKTVEREPRFIRVSSYELLGWQSPCIDFRVHCSKGTYVRTLAHDLGKKLQCGAHLSRLRRTEIDLLKLEQAVSLQDLASFSAEQVRSVLVSSRDAIPSSVVS